MRRFLFLTLLAMALATTAADAQPNARKVLNLFNDICLATIGDAFASATEVAHDLGFATEPAGSFVELHAPGYSGGWSRPAVPRNEKYCEIGSTTADRVELTRLIEERLLENTGRKPQPVKHPLADTAAWSIPYEGGQLYYAVTLGFNDDPTIGATAQITFNLAGH